MSTDNARGQNAASTVFRSLANNFGMSTSNLPNSNSSNISYRDSVPINEFTDAEYALCGAFPDVFFYGRAYGRKNGGPTQKKKIHLLYQFTAAPSTCIPLIFYLFDQLCRHETLHGMSVKVKSDKEAFEKLSREIGTDSFKSRLRKAVKDPEGEDAKYILGKVLPVLNISGRNTPFGAVERRLALSKIYALQRRYGAPSIFLTIAVDDINNPTSFRLTFRSVDNSSFPAIATNDYFDALESNSTIIAEG